MPFSGLTDFALEQEFESAKKRIKSLMKENNFDKLLKEQQFLNIINDSGTKCKYYDIEDFVSLNLSQRNHIKIFSMNISSLPRHAGELVCFLNSLETEFDLIILCEIGKYNLSLVENLFPGCISYFEPPKNNPKGGVGVFISNKLGKIIRNTDVEFVKTCGCATCETECICLSFQYYDVPITIMGIYRHPRGNKTHFIKDLEISLSKINKKHFAYVIGDINIDLILFDKIKVHSNYASMLLSNGYLPYLSFPTRIGPHSATLIDHIFMKSPNKNIDVTSGILYADITDHLPSFISLKVNNKMSSPQRPKVRLYGERQCNHFINEMNNFNWSLLYSDSADWYHEFVSAVYNIFASSFPLVTVSKKRIKDKIWLTKGLKQSCKTNSRLYKKSILNPNTISVNRYQNYNKILKKCLREAEVQYHAEIFQNHENSYFVSKSPWGLRPL